jgi:two-component system, OmpR family, sensor histidine kinase ChvG
MRLDTAASSQRPPWSARVPLRWRILAVNIFVIALLAGGLFYLDSYRARLVQDERAQLADDAELLAELAFESPFVFMSVAPSYARRESARVRLYDAQGALSWDSFTFDRQTYQLRDPAQQSWPRHVARAMDRGIDWMVGARTPSAFVEPRNDIAAAWPEIRMARQLTGPATTYRFAPDRTPVLSAATRVWRDGSAILITDNARNITTTVRAVRLDWLLLLAGGLIISVLLSRFLARTIAEPLHKLARAALLVRLGRARDVEVPRLPERRDEIGQLARAVSDMASALRGRIDAGEQFAADVTHELKNPLASLRSAIETLERVDDPALQQRLITIAAEDVQRLDRLVTSIAEASRLDAQLSRTRFEPIDIGELIEAIIVARRQRGGDSMPRIAFARPRIGTAIVPGVREQLARVVENLLDNALSFSPAKGIVRLSATCAGTKVVLRVEDDGPGVPPAQRDEIFRRFYSLRPDGAEGFGHHSGLGLAIARTIIEAHDGSIAALDRDGGDPGACFEVRLPSATPC